MAEGILANLSAANGTKRAAPSTRDSDQSKMVQLMAKLVINHEMEISTLVASCSWAVLITSASLQQELVSVRKQYKDKGLSEAPNKEGSHPPLRVACHATVLLSLGKVVQPHTAAAKAQLEEVLALDQGKASLALTRFKPKMPNPPKEPGKAWVWILSTSANSDGAAVSRFWASMAGSSIKDSPLKVEVPHVGAGSMARELRDLTYGGSSSSSTRKAARGSSQER